MIKINNCPIPSCGGECEIERRYEGMLKIVCKECGLGKLKPGSSIVCEPSEVNTLASALRKGIETKRYAALIGCKVISRRCCPDGNGRVWAMSQKGA